MIEFWDVDKVKADMQDSLNSPLAYKYARVNGQYRFCDVGDDHRSLVDSGETADSAAQLWLRRDKSGQWRGTPESYSQMLGVGYDVEDVETLPELLGYRNGDSSYLDFL